MGNPASLMRAPLFGGAHDGRPEPPDAPECHRAPPRTAITLATIAALVLIACLILQIAMPFIVSALTGAVQ
jgi:hypothetical protein